MTTAKWPCSGLVTVLVPPRYTTVPWVGMTIGVESEASDGLAVEYSVPLIVAVPAQLAAGVTVTAPAGGPGMTKVATSMPIAPIVRMTVTRRIAAPDPTGIRP